MMAELYRFMLNFARNIRAEDFSRKQVGTHGTQIICRDSLLQ